ncbi:hypothetical protein EKN51_10605 [Enterobacter hormaechei]|uniref:hypothetical protein n=1 Tax=Enterobacter hormaechei TaxID=158836 RepID=UPI000F831699|nr:hypothetical protein [Enterobacter hormaechei]RTP16280.1 hypothetical protein EKN51_10605 [Enterobacter hormaechei]
MGACALVLAKCDGESSSVAPVVRANHKTPEVEANYAASDLVPFTDWNDVTDHTTTHFKCSGGQSVTVDDLSTTDKDLNGSLPVINMYEFISVSQNGFVIAKNDVLDSRYYHEGVQSQDYTGAYLGKASAGGKNVNGNEVVFTFFTVTPPDSGSNMFNVLNSDNKTKANKYYLSTQTLDESNNFAGVQYTCEKIK